MEFEIFLGHFSSLCSRAYAKFKDGKGIVLITPKKLTDFICFENFFLAWLHHQDNHK